MVLEPKKIKSATISISPSICHEVMGPDAMSFVFWMLSFKPAFLLLFFSAWPWVNWSCYPLSLLLFSHSVVYDSLWSHGLQHARRLCSPLSLEVCSNSIKSVVQSNHLILCHPLLLLLSMFPSITVFSTESVLPIRWMKYWSFRFSLSPSNEYSGFISFRIDWFDLLAVQGTFKSLLSTTDGMCRELLSL